MNMNKQYRKSVSYPKTNIEYSTTLENVDLYATLDDEIQRCTNNIRIIKQMIESNENRIASLERTMNSIHELFENK